MCLLLQIGLANRIEQNDRLAMVKQAGRRKKSCCCFPMGLQYLKEGKYMLQKYSQGYEDQGCDRPKWRIPAPLFKRFFREMGHEIENTGDCAPLCTIALLPFITLELR